MSFTDDERLIARCGWMSQDGEEVRQGEMFVRGALSHIFATGRDARPLIHEMLHRLQRESRLRINHGVLKVLYKGDDFELLAQMAARDFEHTRIDLYATLIAQTGEHQALATERRALQFKELADRLVRESTKAEALTVLQAACSHEIATRIDQPHSLLARDVEDAIGFYYTQMMRMRAGAVAPYAAKRPQREEIKWNKLAPGLRHGVLTGQYRFGSLRANLLEISPKKWRLDIVDARELAPDKRSLIQVAQAGGAAFATGGGFSLTSELESIEPGRLGEPIGLLVSRGEVLWPPTYRRTALLTDAEGKVDIWRVGLIGTRLHIGKATIVVRKVNDGRLGPGEIGVYSPAFGRRVPAAPIMLTILGFQVVGLHLAEDVDVPINGLVVAINPGPADPGPLATIEPGDRVRFELPAMRGLGPLHGALAGGPALVTDGQRDGNLVADGFTADSPPLALAPRTRAAKQVGPRLAWGVTEDYRLFALCVDGHRVAESVGLTLDETARLMRALGCVRAVHFAANGAARMVVAGNYVDANEGSDLLPADDPAAGVALSSAVLIVER
ncbi:MAG: phosphodiester glycosidase family protein [Candidatus Lernaella stagnicola]|nr:phosphodiester glycosidase family protein [Candidatus Lernaella stagnicola]